MKGCAETLARLRMNRRSFVTSALAASASSALAGGAPRDRFHAAACEGVFPKHLQGFCTDGRDAIFWCFTTVLVKTDAEGRVLKQAPVASHHGDLCHRDGRVYVAVNLGRFNEPAGKADSWVYVYDADSLKEVARHPVQEVVHGAGGMAFDGARFIIVGGLPPGVSENYAYEYDEAFKFQKRHAIASGYTLMGIQTVAHADGAWWFGCYGKPTELVRADENFRFTGRWKFNASFGIAPLERGRFLIAQDTAIKGKDGSVKGHQARLMIARADESAGLVIESRP